MLRQVMCTWRSGDTLPSNQLLCFPNSRARIYHEIYLKLFLTSEFNMTEQTDEELLKAVKESLMRDGRLDKFKAELRAAVISVLNKPPANDKPEIPVETRLINELILEYLEWNGYRYTEQILMAESGQSEKMTREALTAQMGVLDDSKTSKIPLLYFMVADFQKKETN